MAKKNAMKIKYPKYKREEKLCTKLSLRDIDLIKRRYTTGRYSQRTLANQFGVVQYTIWYVLLPEEKRKEYNRYCYLSKGNLKSRYGLEQISKIDKKFYERKKKLFPQKYLKWHTLQVIESRKKNK